MIRGALVGALLVTGIAWADRSDRHRERRPDLFHPETGLRISRYRAPTPDDVPMARRVSADEARHLSEQGAILIDVGAAAQSRFDELDGTWLVNRPHHSLPGAVWLPEIGRGTLSPTLLAYARDNLASLTGGDPDRDVVVFCIADCWMSWNAAQRLAGFGYAHVHWFAEGTDGWLDKGWPLSPVKPVPVAVD